MSKLISLLTALCFVFIAAPVAAVEHPPLPYADSALEPYISQRTLQIHHGKHHAKYVNTANSMIKGTPYEKKDIQDIIKETEGTNRNLFNNAAQSWNHAFYWKCMKPKGGGVPKGVLLEKIKHSFGSFEKFRKQFAEAGNTAFGSGWAWLVYSSNDNKLSVTKTIGAGNPMCTPGMIPLLTMDVWEHAYYLDYQNRRDSYVDVFLDKLVNWDFVQENLQRAMDAGEGAEL